MITLSEVLVQPIVKGRTDLQKGYRDLLLLSSNFHTVPTTARIGERAAGIRAVYGLRLPDAMQVAFALDAGCEVMVCNDRSMSRIKELAVLVLEDIEL